MFCAGCLGHVWNAVKQVLRKDKTLFLYFYHHKQRREIQLPIHEEGSKIERHHQLFQQSWFRVKNNKKI